LFCGIFTGFIFPDIHMKRFLVSVSIFLCFPSFAQKHSFALSPSAFFHDGKPFQIIGGELHPARIPSEYWKHRIQMAKAMVCNTIPGHQ
jgi:beta-galactosidase